MKEEEFFSGSCTAPGYSIILKHTSQDDIKRFLEENHIQLVLTEPEVTGKNELFVAS